MVKTPSIRSTRDRLHAKIENYIVTLHYILLHCTALHWTIAFLNQPAN